jgi:hypothetical protein
MKKNITKEDNDYFTLEILLKILDKKETIAQLKQIKEEYPLLYKIYLKNNHN